MIIPVFDVEDYLPACLDSVLAARHRDLDVVVVDDGSTDGSGDVADRYAAADTRVRVVHVTNGGLGAARNVGLQHVRGEFIAFADSDDTVPATAYSGLLRSITRTGTAMATGGVLRDEDGVLVPMPWLDRLHAGRGAIDVGRRPELLGDVFAWNKLFRRDFWEGERLAWPEGVRYEDQPTTTAAFLAAGRVGVVADPVYHWRIRTDGSSITQQRASLRDLQDRWTTKRSTLAAVSAADPGLVEVVRERVLPGDMWRYFELIPEADDDWWRLLVDGVREFWPDGGLVRSVLPPVHRLVGWLVEHDRRADATAVVGYRRELTGPLPRMRSADGTTSITVPVLAPGSVPPEVLRLRPAED